MNVPKPFIAWIFNYLTNRPQHVKLPVSSSAVSTSIRKSSSSSSYVLSDTIHTNTGAPQGTVLAPFLFTLYTADGRQTDDSCPLIKFADDTSQVGKIHDKDDSVYLSEVQKFVRWCEDNYLHLNTSKTREMLVDFTRTRKDALEPVRINGVEVERVDAHRYLGVVFDSKLKFHDNTNDVLKRVQSRLYCLRKLRSFDVKKEIMQMFYSSTISSVLMYGAVCWGGNLAERERGRLDKVIKKAGYSIGETQETFDTVYHKRLTNRTVNILDDKTHPLWGEFDERRNDSGRLRLPTTRTNRYKNSFVPRAINELNRSYSRHSEEPDIIEV